MHAKLASAVASDTKVAPARPARAKIVAAASPGGHWEQLMLLRDVLDQHDTVYVTTNPDLAKRASIARAYVVADCNRDKPLNAVRSLARAFAIVFREQPDCVITTGALPGLFTLIAGRMIGAKTIWIDSVANTEKLSMSGAAARRIATLWLTQWKHLATSGGPCYMGSLL